MEDKLNALISENQFQLYKKIAHEIRAERKYAEPLMSSRKVKRIAHWRFCQYVLMN